MFSTPYEIYLALFTVLLIFDLLNHGFSHSRFEGLVNGLLLLSLEVRSVIDREFNTVGFFFRQNELLLQDGFFIDFLQKQTLELWLRQYILSTGSIFSERLVFEFVTKFFFKFLLWPIKARLHFETVTVSDLLTTSLYMFLCILFITVNLFLFL